MGLHYRLRSAENKAPYVGARRSHFGSTSHMHHRPSVVQLDDDTVSRIKILLFLVPEQPLRAFPTRGIRDAESGLRTVGWSTIALLSLLTHSTREVCTARGRKAVSVARKTK